jgi:predicted nuclease of predicted toxin-antitoxin system
VSDASLFIQLYLDEDVSVLVAQLLRPHGFEALTTRDAHNLGNSDAAQLRYAAENHRTLLTHNRIDYERLHAEGLRDQRPHAGILIANRRASDFDLARRIMTVLNRFTHEEIANQLLYL